MKSQNELKPRSNAKRQSQVKRQSQLKRGAKKRVSESRKKLSWNLPEIDFGRWFSLAGQLVLTGAVVASIWAIWPYVNRPVVQVEFTGSLDRVDTQELRNRVKDSLNGGLLTLDIKGLDAQVEQVDWVYAAEIQKIWPQTLSIEIEQEQPVASWGSTGYLTASGKMVESRTFDDLAYLPSFDVGAANPQEALDLFFGLNTAMMTMGFALQELNQTEFGSWSMVLENGSEIVLGKEDLLIRMQRVMHAWQKLVPEHINDIEAVDARYPNGIAVKYREQHREEIVQQEKQHSRGSNI